MLSRFIKPLNSGQQIRSKIDSFQNANFLISQPNPMCYHSLESSRRDDFNEGHIIGFSWEMRKLSWKQFCSLFLNSSPKCRFMSQLRLTYLIVHLFKPKRLWRRCHTQCLRRSSFQSWSQSRSESHSLVSNLLFISYKFVKFCYKFY